MTYFSQDGAMHGSWLTGRYVPAAPITRVLCDKCAETEVPFETKNDGLPMQARPWKWAPSFGDNCHSCGNRC